MKPLKKLPCTLKQVRKDPNKDKYDKVNIYFQDESHFGLMTKQKRVLISKRIKPIGKYSHSYKWLWLWGCFSPITGEGFYREDPIVSNQIFEGFLQEFSLQDPKVVVIDNAGFHACQHIEVPENIYLIRIPPYSPELNPAEKVWQLMKAKVAMKFFEDIENLQLKITEMVRELDKDLVKSIRGYDLYTKLFFENFES